MDRAIIESETAAPNDERRYPLYMNVHKALRHCATDTLVRVGNMDCADDAEVAATLAQVREMLLLSSVHLIDEDRFVQPALSKADPGNALRVAADHGSHRQEFEALHQDVDALATASCEAQRAEAAARLYRRLALLAAQDFEHMHFEETQSLARLWSAYSFEELAALEQAIVASIPQETMGRFLYWMLPAITHADRLTLLTEMREHAPEAFEAVVALARERLAQRQWMKLAAALELS